MSTTRRRRRSSVRIAAFGVGAVLIASCGLGTAGGFTPPGTLAGPLKDVPSFDGADVAVGSKNFSEQLLLGKMAVILLRSAGANVKDFTNIPGSSSARQAMLENQIQMQWEYTGTAWIAYLGQTDPIPDEHKQWQAVHDRDLRQNHLVWLPPAPMNNTYGFAAKASTARRLGITKLSQLKDMPVNQRTFCVESEFNNRNDGFGPMLKTYGLKRGTDVPNANVKILDTGAIYEATNSGLCNFAEVFTTDGRIKALDLTVLEDDKHFFPAYNVSPVFTKKFYDDHPQVTKLFDPVAAKLTDDVLIDLNAEIDVDGREPSQVAFDWLKKEGFITDN